jgi:hypothetical protein
MDYKMQNEQAAYDPRTHPSHLSAFARPPLDRIPIMLRDVFWACDVHTGTKITLTATDCGEEGLLNMPR